LGAVNDLAGSGGGLDAEDPVALRSGGALADRHIGRKAECLVGEVLARVAVRKDVEGEIRVGRKHVESERANDGEHQ